MKHLVIAAIALWALFQVSALLWTPRDPFPKETFSRFIEAPPRVVADPYRNSYFYFFGLTAAPSLDPGQAGYEVWVETTHNQLGASESQKPGQTELHRSTATDSLVSEWDAEDPLAEFRKNTSALQAVIRDNRLLLNRYERLLGLPFEDWGFGSRALPRYRTVFAAHRLYAAEGFSLDTWRGLDRLRKEMQCWRLILREARTIHTKVFAQLVIADDLRLLSHVLAKPNLDKNMFAFGLQLSLPLTDSEYSLRWAIRNQLALAAAGPHRVGSAGNEPASRHESELEWLTQAANLPPSAFDDLEHPSAPSSFGMAFPSAQGGATYAAYYDAAIKASESRTGQFPRMTDIASTVQRGWVERLLNPRPIEPGWARFYRQLMETDARLRLASLQIQLKRPSAQTTVPTRLAEIGSPYFDPFTGLPMLWSPTQQKLYSVGQDRLDDGGDPTFDISVSAVLK